VKFARAAAVCILVLSLGSCEVAQFLLGTVFPPTTTLQRGEADLSGAIASGDAGSFSLKVVDAGKVSYLVLLGTPGSTNVATAYIYSLGLDQKKTLTGKLPSGTVFSGSGVMYDRLNDLIAIGNAELSPSDLAVAAELPSGLSINRSGSAGVDGFSDTDTPLNIVSFGIPQGTSNLMSGAYDTSWTGITRTAGAFPPGLSSTTDGYSLSGVFDDGDPTGNVILAIQRENSSVTTYFVTIPKNGFGTDPAGAGLLDSAPHRDDLQANTLGFAQGAFTGFDTVARSFVRVDPVTMATKESFLEPFSTNNVSKLSFAYPVAGGSYYVWDPDTRLITEFAAWW
jgi:hypothetical protein